MTNLIRTVDNDIEFYTVKETGVSGMSQRGLARFIGVDEKTLRELLGTILRGSATGKCLKPLLGKDLTCGGVEGIRFIQDIHCASLIEYYAVESKVSEAVKQQAQAALLSFSAIGLRTYIQQRTGWTPVPVSNIPALPQNYLEALKALVASEEENQQLRLECEAAKPKVEFFDQIIDSKDSVDMGQAAKLLKFQLKNNKYLGRNTLYELLRQWAILDDYNTPYQRYVDQGYFAITETKMVIDDIVRVTIKTLVTQKGLDWLQKVLSSKLKAE